MRVFGSISLILRTVAVAMMLGLAACGGDDDPAPAVTDPPGDDGQGADGGQDDGDDAGDGGDDDGGDDNNADGDLAATLSVDESLGATETLVVTFTEAVDQDALELAGSLAEHAVVEWAGSDVLELSPATWWPPGEQTLVVDASSADGAQTVALESRLTVAAAFATGAAADLVIGQADFSGGEARQDEDAPTAQANTLDFPSAPVAYAASENLLYIADSGESRVLGFEGIPTVNNANADFVIGQPDFTSSSGGVSRTLMRSPQGISANSGELIVGDRNANRVLVYDGLPQDGPGEAAHVIGQENGAVPDQVLGQSSFDTCAVNDVNQDGITGENEMADARTMQHPSGVWSDDERLVVVDNYNNRVLIWNEFPAGNFAPADIVLGQAQMSAIAANDDNQDGEPDANASARVLNYPWSAWVEGEQLFVADELNNRVLVWNEWPQASFAPADEVIGQPDFASMAPNRGAGQPSALTLNMPKGVRVIGRQLFVTDTANSRVLVYDAE